jgi:hypothetical protein
VTAAILAVGIVSGVASWMPERFGPDYLALPGGPGQTVTICAERCLRMTSTDAGPDKAMQRRGRVADIGVKAWEYICGLPRSAGLCRVTVRYGPLLVPATDTAAARRLGWVAS